MQTNPEEITAFQLAQLAAQLDPKNPEETLDRAHKLFNLAGEHIKTERDFVLRFEKALQIGLPPEDELEKIVQFKTGQGADSSPGNEFYALLRKLLTSSGVTKFGQGQQNAPTTDDVRGKLRLLSKVAAAAADGGTLPRSYSRVERACGPFLFEMVVKHLNKAPWSVVFAVSGRRGKGPVKGIYNLPVWAAHAVQRIWEIPEPAHTKDIKSNKPARRRS